MSKPKIFVKFPNGDEQPLGDGVYVTPLPDGQVGTICVLKGECVSHAPAPADMPLAMLMIALVTVAQRKAELDAEAAALN